MKSMMYITVLLFLLISCSEEKIQPLTEDEKTEISKEVNSTVDLILSACNNLDADLAFNNYDSDKLTFVGIDGSLGNYDLLLRTNREFFEMCSTANFNSIKKMNKIINRELVLNTLIYSVDIEFKTGEKMRYDKIGATFLFKKVDNKWIVTYFHESGNPPS